MILVPTNIVEKIKYFSNLLGLIFIEITKGPLIVIGKYERLKKQKTKKKKKERKEKERKKEKRNFPGLYAYQNVLLYTHLLHKPTLTHT